MNSPIRLGDVAEFIRGITFKPTDLVGFGEPNSVVCMRTKNVQEMLDERDLISVPNSFVKKGKKILQEGDLLVSTANSFDLVGKACWVSRLDYPATAGGFIAILRADKSKLNPRYLYHWTTSGQVKHLLKYCGRQTTNISNMDIGRALDLKIPLPTLKEQRRIAAILDKADAIRRKRQRAIELTETFLRSVFLDMFGDPGLNPNSFPEKTLGEIESGKMNNGIFKKNSDYIGGMPVAWVGELFRGDVINFDQAASLAPTKKELRTYGLKTGDLLFCRSSLKLEGIGWNNVYIGPDKEALFECHIIRMSPNKDIVDPIFLNYQLRFPNIRKRVFRQAKTVTMTTIDQDGLSGINVMIPPVEKQRIFSKILLATLAKEKRRVTFLTESNKLFNTLSQKAFKGELTQSTTPLEEAISA